MKKIIAALLATLSISASAADLTVYDLNSRGNPGSAVTERWIKELESQGIKVSYQAGLTCAGRDRFTQEKGPAVGIVFTGRVWASLYRGEDQCVVDLNSVRPVGSYEYAVKVCTRSDSGLGVQDITGKKSLKIAVAGNTNPHGIWVKSLNQSYGTNHTAITSYKNSGAVSLAVMSGDADFGLISALTTQSLEQSGKMTCVATTDVRDGNSIRRVFPKADPVLSSNNGIYAILSRNTDPVLYEKVRLAIIKIGKQLKAEGQSGLGVSELDAAGIKDYVEKSVNEVLASSKKIQ